MSERFGEEVAPSRTPDWSGLTDEELAEKLKSARLGDGLIAEKALRDFRKLPAVESPEKE